ncbi:hypothetical protein [Phenylobacterium sp. SCN 70-31]|uniref:hypothetical protein n=1 Tax=Phenylobacterium sp. SCN 70-31 TaxID=1660129 RepID=UPI000868F770|nr:hypothetical protein [Phenylobacterium sp. SCN 70-31]ODT85136.1 MAG: hypothetical protein ABS78_21375 [Phenylobacterium sp. SCN 70-31]
MEYSRRFRLAVSVVALLSMNAQPSWAQRGGRDTVLNACDTQRAPLVRLDKEYDDLKRSKMSAAIGEGLKTGAMVLAKGVMSGQIGGRATGGGFGGLSSGFGSVGGIMGAVGGMAMQSAAQQQAGAPAAAPNAGMMFGQDMLTGAMGLNVPGISNVGFSGGDNTKAYAALAVLVAIVATADAYAKLKEQEAGGDLKKASFNIDQDAGRQLAVSREIASSGQALVECRATQLEDINTRLASASTDKDRRAIRRERTDLIGALKKDIDVTGSVVDQHTGMAKTFTQGRAMTDNASEADVLGNQTPAYASAAATTRLSMQAGPAPAGGPQQAAPPPAAPPPALVAVRAAVLRSAPVASAAPVRNLPVGTSIQAKTSQAEGGWWEVDVGGATGFVRAAEVGPPGSAPVQQAAAGRNAWGKATPAAKAPPPPAVAGPTNIRAYNQSVIAARTDGKDRLSALMTDIQSAQRRESVLYAMLANLGRS